MAAPAISSPTSIGAKLATTVGAYVALTKPRIIELLLVTTVPVMVVADQGVPPLWLMAAAVIGGSSAGEDMGAAARWLQAQQVRWLGVDAAGQPRQGGE